MHPEMHLCNAAKNAPVFWVHIQSKNVDFEPFLVQLRAIGRCGCADGVLWIQVPTPAFKEMAERYTDHINAALAAEEIRDIREVRFTC